MCRQAHVQEDSREDDDRCALINDSRDVKHDDADRMLKTTKSAVDHHGDATSTTRPRRPATDEVDAAADAFRRVSAASSSQPRARQVSPSPPIPTSATGDRNPPSPQRSSRPAPRSPDTDRWRCRPDRRRPESSPTARRVSCGDQAPCDRADSVDGVGPTAGRRTPAVARANTTGEYLLQVSHVN